MTKESEGKVSERERERAAEHPGCSEGSGAGQKSFRL